MKAWHRSWAKVQGDREWSRNLVGFCQVSGTKERTPLALAEALVSYFGLTEAPTSSFGLAEALDFDFGLAEALALSFGLAEAPSEKE